MIIKVFLTVLLAFGTIGQTLLANQAADNTHCVILLHGLARSADSMSDLEKDLEKSGYVVANIDYPSRENTVAELADLAIPQGILLCEDASASTISFVTHSMGGILVRQYLSQNSIPLLGRVVMLAPPNQGSQVVDELGDVPGFGLINGPAGQQLGTSDDSVPVTLGAVDFELGVIAGTRSINLLLSALLPNPDDGKVSVANTKVDGMCGFLALPVSHPFIMSDEHVIAQVKAFLTDGAFTDEGAESFACSARQ